MKTTLVIFMFLTSAALIAIALTACESPSRVADSTAIAQPPININLDESSAAQIAEIIFVRAYGEQVLNEKPWQVTKTDHVYVIEGSPLPEGYQGGVASLQINRDNAEVIAISHGQ
ncbi:MAG: NTF2 fold immunity protein [Phycisphaeraceae bacterium]